MRRSSKQVLVVCVQVRDLINYDFLVTPPNRVDYARDKYFPASFLYDITFVLHDKVYRIASNLLLESPSIKSLSLNTTSL